jgi:DNA-binding transcriptional MerR regulator
MRVSELSRATGVAVATIKYYLREGLLQPGTPTARNQADYDDSHAHRLRLIRVLIEIGGLGIATVRRVLEAVDDPSVPMHEVLGVAHHALAPQRQVRWSIDTSGEIAEVDDLLSRLGWQVSPNAPARIDLAGALAALRRLGWNAQADIFRPYAALVDTLASREVANVSEQRTRGATVERVVVGTVVFETALLALRRLAQENHSARRFAAAGESAT